MEEQTLLESGFNPVSQNRMTMAHVERSMPLAVSPSEMPYEIIHYKEGDVIFRQGEASRGLYLIQSGCVKLQVLQPQVRGRTGTPEYIRRLIGAGEYFGYKSLIQGAPLAAEARAVKATTVRLYNKATVESLIQNSSPLVKAVLKQSLSDLQSHENSSQFNYLASVQERIAYQLLHLAEKFGVKKENGVSINLKLTRNELAQLASTINESLSRHLTEFKSEGLIELNGKEILVKDLNQLRSKLGVENL